MTSLATNDHALTPCSGGSPASACTRRTLLGGGLATFTAPALPVRAATRPPAFFGLRSQFVFLDPPEAASHIPLRALDGKDRTIGTYRGKAILLNFWASWCPPCRRELPILHRLQSQARDEPFVVLPVSLDKSPAVASAYLQKLGLEKLASFIDSSGDVASGPRSKVATPFPLYGMPMCYVLDREGRSVGYIVGEADWAGPDGLALLRFYGEA